MNLTLTIPPEAVPAWELRVDQFNAGSGQPPVTIQQFCQLVQDEETARLVSTLKTVQREAMIPVADEILAVSPEKQTAAIAAALAEVRA